MKQKDPPNPSDRVYAYLNIDDPICAWATYRGVLSSPPTNKGFLSVWHAGILKSGDMNRLRIEMKLEEVRTKYFPQMTSRLRGMFCFRDLDSVRLASRSWRNHFSPPNLSELKVLKVSNQYRNHDANWFTWANDNPSDSLSTDKWIEDYWIGNPLIQGKSIWETIIDGEFIVRNNRIRKEAYARIRDEFPDSVSLLEIARIAARINSNLGAIQSFLLTGNDNKIELNYMMDMQDIENSDFLSLLRKFLESEEPINKRDLATSLSRGFFGHTPDLRRYSQSWQLAE